MSLRSKQKIVFQLFFAAFTLSILSAFFTPTSNLAHAASNGAGSTITETKTISLPESDCRAIAKKYPQFASKSENCYITITSTSTKLPGFTTKIVYQKQARLEPAIALSCPSGSIFHDAVVTGTFNIYGARMREYFNWHGNCSAPSVTEQNCTYDSWATLPASSTDNTYCGSYSDHSGGTIAEGDYIISWYLQAGKDSRVLQSSASGRNTIISDATN